MATKQEVAEILFLINQKYPEQFPDVTEMILEHWRHTLDGFSQKIMLVGLEYWIDKNPDKAPSSIQFLKACEIVLEHQQEPIDPLREIMEKMGSYTNNDKNWPKDKHSQLLLRTANKLGGLEAINKYDDRTVEFKRKEFIETYKILHSLDAAGVLDAVEPKNLLTDSPNSERKYFMTNAEAEKYALSKCPGTGLSAKDWFEMGMLGVKDPQEWKEKGYAASPIYAKPGEKITPEQKKKWDDAKAKVDEEIKNEFSKPIINYTKLYGGSPFQVLKGEELQKFKDQRRKDILAHLNRQKKEK